MSEQQFLIPKLIHQTYKSSNVPAAVVPLMHSWRRNNPDWEVRFYDDDACLRFVQREFPEYLAAYKSLPKDVERSDFFRHAPSLKQVFAQASRSGFCKLCTHLLVAALRCISAVQPTYLLEQKNFRIYCCSSLGRRQDMASSKAKKCPRVSAIFGLPLVSTCPMSAPASSWYSACNNCPAGI